jgi:6-phosphogluconolactonase
MMHRTSLCVAMGWLCLAGLPLSSAAAADTPAGESRGASEAIGTGPAPQGAPAPANERSLFAYVGTFSSPLGDVLPTQVDLPPGNGRGIHFFRVDRRTGALVDIGTVDMGTSPSSLVINAAGTRLYSANETDRVGDDRQGTVSSFAIDRTNGGLTRLNTVPSGAAGPTHVSLHPAGRHVLVANYFGGAVAVLPIQPDGRLGAATDVEAPQGTIGPTRATSAPPGSFAFSGHDRTHAHMVEASPDGRFVFHADLGLDRIFVWAFDAATGTLEPAATPWIALPPGDGPRHFDLHPDGRWFYSIQEEGATVALFDFDAETGRLTPRGTWPTLPAGFAGSTFCSEILIAPDGRHLYAGNRLHDSIAVFEIGRDGTLAYQGEQWSRGNYPRSFNLDPYGRFLYCCNQRSDNLAIFRIDAGTGSPEFTGRFVPVGNPSCIVFLDTVALP